MTTKPVTQFYFKEDYWTFWGGDQFLTFQILIFIYLWYNLKKKYYFRGTQANTKLHRPWVLGVSKWIPEPTQPTGADDIVPTPTPIEWAEVGVRRAKLVPTPVRCSHRIKEGETNPHWYWTDTKPSNCFSLQFGYNVVHRF